MQKWFLAVSMQNHPPYPYKKPVPTAAISHCSHLEYYVSAFQDAAPGLISLQRGSAQKHVLGGVLVQ